MVIRPDEVTPYPLASYELGLLGEDVLMILGLVTSDPQSGGDAAIQRATQFLQIRMSATQADGLLTDLRTALDKCRQRQIDEKR